MRLEPRARFHIDRRKHDARHSGRGGVGETGEGVEVGGEAGGVDRELHGSGWRFQSL